jgi:hypothetical protein
MSRVEIPQRSRREPLFDTKRCQLRRYSVERLLFFCILGDAVYAHLALI